MPLLKRKIWKGAKAKKKAKTVNITTQNLQKEVAKQGTGKTMWYSQNNSAVLTALNTQGTPRITVKCISAPLEWTQVFDNNADTGDQKLPRAQCKHLSLELGINLITPGISRLVNVYLVAMKTDLFTYLNGAEFTSAQMTLDETHTNYSQNFTLNPAMFDIKHHWRRFIGDNTAKQGSPAGGNLTQDMHSRNITCNFDVPIEIAYQAGVRGWKSIGETELPASKRLYWIVAQSSIYSGAGETGELHVYASALWKVVY